MKKLFEISSEEKQRILEMHESATKKNYLSEDTVQKILPPKPEILKPLGVSFKINDILSVWQSQSQGFTGNYYWVASVSGEAYGASYIHIKSLMWYGDLRDFFTLRYIPQQKQWELLKSDVSTSGMRVEMNEILRTLVIYNPTNEYVMGGSAATKYKLNNATYDTYVKAYVTNNPDSTPAKAFKTPKEKIVASKDVPQAQIDMIKKSPLYLALNTSLTPTTPTSTTPPPAR
jgi:hypothetical protein